MIEELKKNVETEMEMLKEIVLFMGKAEKMKGAERELVIRAVRALTNGMKILNNSIPTIVKNISETNALPSLRNSSEKELEKIKYEKSNSEKEVTLKIKDKERFLREINVSKNLISKLKKKTGYEEENVVEFKAARGYLKLANKIFLDKAKEMIRKGYFKPLSIEIKRANLDILFETYIAMMFLTSAISLLVCLGVTIFLIFFSVSPAYPFLSIFEGNFLTRLAQIFWIPFVVPAVTFLVIYYYPTAEKKSLEKKIDHELPFAVIHMGAISGSGIAPSEIFRIIGASKEYPSIRKEIRKVLNQINLYGYDLVTSVTNASKTTPSIRLAELFSGLATTIHSGGDLSEFFEKRAESLLVSYRLEREKYTKIAETFMDIYISVVIAAPMILMLLLILISVSKISIGLSPMQISFMVIAVISLINIFFLIFLKIRQPID